ncbi:MAG TPA: hypothetical protein VKE40_27920 [Gemmataceae bacterium]|nr:hypothetical protein [Gemmataceae bacterium]
MDAVFPLAALAVTLMATCRTLGLGVGAAIAVGYVNGVARANFLGVFSTFTFDGGLLGLYAGAYLFHSRRFAGVWSGSAAKYLLFLIAWPTLMTLMPVNDLLVQLVALRGTVWFLPVVLIASRLNSTDLTVVTRVLAVMNLVALAGGVYVYHNGVEALYPENAVTQIIYKSKDVGNYEYYRIPSTFLSSHAYGGTMLYSLPFLLGHLFGPRVGWPDRVLVAAGVAAAAAGILLCAARMPVVMFAVTTLATWVFTRFDPKVGLVAIGLIATAIGVALTDERMQRAGTLEDTEAISGRVKGSANESFLELLTTYPMGAGMGSSVGTSIPFFLADRAPEQVGLENEFSRILVDQGWVGLAGWLAFLVWLLRSPPPLLLWARWGAGVMIMYGLCVSIWVTGFIGTGALSAVPQSVMLLVMMGILVRVREAGRDRE